MDDPRAMERSFASAESWPAPAAGSPLPETSPPIPEGPIHPESGLRSLLKRFWGPLVAVGLLLLKFGAS